MFSTEQFLQDFLGFFKKLFFTVYDCLFRHKLFIRKNLISNDYYIKPTLFIVLIFTFCHYFLTTRGSYTAPNAGAAFISNISSKVLRFSLTENLLFAIPLVLFAYFSIKSFSTLYSKIGYFKIQYKFASYLIGTFFIIYLIIRYCVILYDLSIFDIYENRSYEFQQELSNISNLVAKYSNYLVALLLSIVTISYCRKLKKNISFPNIFLYLLPLTYSAILFLLIQVTSWENSLLNKFYPLNTIDFQSKYPTYNDIDFEITKVNDSICRIGTDLVVSNNTAYPCFLKHSERHQLSFLDKNGHMRPEFSFFNKVSFQYKVYSQTDSSFLVLKPYETKSISFESYFKTSELDSSKIGSDNRTPNCYIWIHLESLNSNFCSHSSNKKNLLINGLNWYKREVQ